MFHDLAHRLFDHGRFQLTFPDHYHFPAGFPQNAVILLVSGFVCADLVLPEFDIRFRHDEFAAAVVPVPETAVDEDHGAVFPQNDVGSAGDVLHVEAVADAVLPQPFADEDFRLGVFAADAGHAVVTLGEGEGVGHQLWIYNCKIFTEIKEIIFLSHHFTDVLSE